MIKLQGKAFKRFLFVSVLESILIFPIHKNIKKNDKYISINNLLNTENKRKKPSSPTR